MELFAYSQQAVQLLFKAAANRQLDSVNFNGVSKNSVDVSD